MRILRRSALLLALLAAPAAASAHPHIFVTEAATVVYDGGMLKALQLVWTFDEMYSAATLQELDTNNDGVFTDEEFSALARQTAEELKDQNYYTSVALGGRALTFGAPEGYRFERKGDAVAFHLTLPFEPPVAAGGEVFSFVTRDPEFMSAFSLEKADPIKITGRAASGCEITAGPTASAAAEIEKQGALFPLGGPGFGLSLTAAGTVRCPPP